MSNKQAPPAERARGAFKQLSSAAQDLNASSDRLNEAISTLETSIQNLNLGVSAWSRLSGHEADGSWWTREIGYTKVKDRWCIALRKCWGNYGYPDEEGEEVWPFAEAPRWMRVESVGKIPDLFDSLLKQTETTTRAIQNGRAQVEEVTAAINFAKAAPEVPSSDVSTEPTTPDTAQGLNATPEATDQDTLIIEAANRARMLTASYSDKKRKG